MTKKEIILEIAKTCPDLADDILALLKRLDKKGEFSGPAKAANEDRYRKLCRDALQTGDFPDSLREELEEIEGALYTHGGYRPGAGRPALPEEHIRKARSIKFTDAEWETIKAKADMVGLSMSEYVRNRALEC